ncbi:MAG: hypothetical protein Q7R89_00080 [bacterium]|nr:hypothetical protein [bacterium]
MKNINKTFLASFLSLSIFFVVGVTLVFAQSPVTNIKLPNPFNCGVANCTLFTLLEKVINNILLPIGGILAVLAFIYSGFLYVTAQGNEAKLKTAHSALLYTAIGTAVLLGSWVIAKVIENTINQLK